MRTTRAAKQSPNAQPLEGYCIVVSKNALERLVQGLIVMYGGSYRYKVDKNTTHVISGQPILSEKNEISQAQDSGPHIVDPDFLIKIISDNGANLDKNAGHCSPSARADNTAEGPENMERKRVRFITKKELNTEEVDKKGFETALEKSSLSIPGDFEPVYRTTLKKANYFYHIEVVKHFKTLTHFGRDGKIWASGSLGDGTFDDAVNKFLDKFKDKTGLAWENRNKHEAIPEKYAFDNVGHNHDSDGNKEAGEEVPENEAAKDVLPPASRRREPVQELMQLILNEEGFNEANIALGNDSDLKDLKIDDIEKGFKTLAKAAAMIRKDRNNGTETYTDKYHEILPGAGKIEIQDLKSCQKQAKPLKGIWDLKNAYEIMKATCNSGQEVHLFDRQLTPLSQESKEFKTLIEYLNNYRVFFNYEVKDIFRINRGEERGGENSNRYLLWHGSRAVNYCSILSHGLRIPPSGGLWYSKLLGNGIYLTDMSSVAAGDCKTNRDALLLLCEADLTKANCTRGITGPKQWIDAKEVHETLEGVQMPDPTLKPETNLTTKGLKYNTYTCYDPTKVKLRYIFRLNICIPGMKRNR
ncbi:Poly [ADP-ribose] polymerase 2 [Fusarium oxysporum f. sp. rapae]|uniref:Poly [ADP-ribose] polymerase n=1 Tax=Fusarium oxysporum f. sp. rapae TaxID=485398 RepID=A0A8J5TMX6_FUSOX|nr:Poly [ADP-ribose] polymerase 2 [Fusarium oxysporum f. sp. rapae]